MSPLPPANTEQSPAPDGTPHYHRRTDTAATVDPDFIGAIAGRRRRCLVGSVAGRVVMDH
jgi:hypothetical protein